ncbi:hypothetical protein HAZT_HAZT011260 [Hyalella azteca]|uniref:PDZ domain-containing protein n=1 Tax=Hyalella azteca TaxID=294128 RepID=A0A6A0HA30_HYAAZ|nr:hypothetical protein HAZT_HAZT011260 [Hyalella azteca]
MTRVNSSKIRSWISPSVVSQIRRVRVVRQRNSGLGLSIKGGAEHKLPILISRIFKDQAADLTARLFVGDAILKVNNKTLLRCTHDEAADELRRAGEEVTLTVRHYKAATPFLNKAADSNSDLSNQTQLQPDSGWRSPSNPNSPTSDTTKTASSTTSPSNEPLTNKLSLDSNKASPNTTNLNKVNCSRHNSVTGSSLHSEVTASMSDALCNGGQMEKQWIDVVTVPLMMAYITRYIFGTDKLRPHAFEVRGIGGGSTGVVHCADAAVMSQWIKHITNNIIGLTNLQMKLYNSSFPANEHVLYMGWVCEGVINHNLPWQSWKPKFIALKGTDIYMFDNPPVRYQQFLYMIIFHI